MIWTPDEKHRLRQLYPHTKECDLEALFPGRKAGSISRKARVLGLTKERTWNKDEEEMLLYLWPRMPHTDLAIVLERSYWSITNKYRLLKGLKKKPVK